jgi:hypothetical protein
MTMDRSTISKDLFHRTLAALKASNEEQVLIERTVGRGILDRLSGKGCDLLTVYRGLGGDDPIAVRMFSELSPVLDGLPVERPIEVAGRVANDPGTLASKSSSVVAGNPLFSVERTALATLADLGGKEFKDRLQVG